MVLPSENPLAGTRVRIVRDKSGNISGFQDPDDRNRFITKTEAVSRLSYDFKIESITDSFGNTMESGGLAAPLKGFDYVFTRVSVHWTPIDVPVERVVPGPNQEIVERVTFIDRDGNLIVHETSYGLGQRYDETKYGGRWRHFASQALGEDSSARLPTEDLQKAVAYKEYLLKTTRNIQLKG